MRIKTLNHKQSKLSSEKVGQWEKKSDIDVLILHIQSYFLKSYNYCCYKDFLKISQKYTVLSTQLIIASLWPICLTILFIVTTDKTDCLVV